MGCDSPMGLKLAILGAIIAVALRAQPSTTTARHIIYGATLPATCSPNTGDVYFLTAGTIGPYYCSAANTWANITGGSGGSGTVTSVGLLGTANQLTVTGTSPITTSGSWTISFPGGGVTLPGTTTGTFSGNITGTASGNSKSVGTPSDLTGIAAAQTSAVPLGSGLAAGHYVLNLDIVQNALASSGSCTYTFTFTYTNEVATETFTVTGVALGATHSNSTNGIRPMNIGGAGTVSYVSALASGTCNGATYNPHIWVESQ